MVATEGIRPLMIRCLLLHCRTNGLVYSHYFAHVELISFPLFTHNFYGLFVGVTNLRALIAREGDDDTPRLGVLLCEAFVACFMALLMYALRVCDAHLLYRLASKRFSAESWASLYGGGVKKLLRTASINVN